MIASRPQSNNTIHPVNLQKQVFDLLRTDETATKYLSDAINLRLFGQLSRIFNELKLTDGKTLEEFAREYSNAIRYDNFIGYTAEKTHQLTSLLLNKNGKIKKECLEIMAAVSGKSIEQIEEIFYGQIPSDIKIKNIANLIVSSAVIAISSEFSDAIRANHENKLPPDLKILSDYSYLVTNLTKSGELVSDQIETFKTIINKLTFDKLQEYVDTYQAMNQFANRLDDKIRDYSMSQDMSKHLNKLISFSVTVKTILSHFQKLPHDALELQIKSIHESLLEDIHQLENELSALEKHANNVSNNPLMQIKMKFFTPKNADTIKSNPRITEIKAEIRVLEKFILDITGQSSTQKIIIDALQEKIQLLDSLHHRLDRDDAFKTTNLINLLQKVKISVADDRKFDEQVAQFDQAYHQVFSELLAHYNKLNGQHLLELEKLSKDFYAQCQTAKNGQLTTLLVTFCSNVDTVFTTFLREASEPSKLSSLKQ